MRPATASPEALRQAASDALHMTAPTVRKATAPMIYLISPSGAVSKPERARQAAGILKSLGMPARFDPAALRLMQRFAGNDEARAGAFARAAQQDAPIIMITRGGYGLTRLLPALDFRALARADKQWVGYSDFTAFHLGMLAKADFTGLPFMQASLSNRMYEPPPVRGKCEAVDALVAEGKTGVMAGAGFYDWGGQDPAALFEARDRRLMELKRAIRRIGTMAGQGRQEGRSA